MHAHNRLAAAMQVNVRCSGLDGLFEQRWKIHQRFLAARIMFRRAGVPRLLAFGPIPPPEMILRIYDPLTSLLAKGDAKMTKTHAIALVLAVVLASCTSKDKKEPPAPASAETKRVSDDSSSLSYTPGVAGGVAQRMVKSSATVSAIEPATRKITLTTEDGSRATFSAPPEMHNFDQLHVGDKVNATLNEQLVVLVGSGATPGATHAAVVARAPKGARPGAMAAETFEVVGTVKAIDTAKRQATLQFVDGDTATVPVREDVDLTKYKVGDSVLIRVTQQLTLLVEKP